MASGTESGFAAIQIKGSEKDVRQAASLDYSGMVHGMRTVFRTGRTKDIAWRKRQLEAVKTLIEENHEALTAAVRADLGGAKLRGIAELGSHANAQMAINNLDSWAADEQVGHDSLFGSSYVRNEPKGVVLIISPWNYPIELALHCMVGVLAAGNCLVLKPSEMSSNSSDGGEIRSTFVPEATYPNAWLYGFVLREHCSTTLVYVRVLAELIPKYFDSDCVKVELGAVAETTALLREKWDHILYTGNGAVGRIVLQAAAKHLTPCTLELGGKSPVYVDKSASLDTCITRLNVWKFLNAGEYAHER